MTRLLVLPPLVAVLAVNPADCPGERVETLLHQNRLREYHFYTPPAHDGVTPLPLVIALHGVPATGVGFRKDTGIDLVAEREGFYVVYPFALDGSWHLRGYLIGVVDDLDFIATLIDHLAQQYPIDLDRIYMAGQSQGGFVAQQMACMMSDRIAGVALIGSGAIPDRVADLCRPEFPTAVIAFHGTTDITVPFEGRDFSLDDIFAGVLVKPVMESMEFWRDVNGCDEDPTVEMLPNMDPNDGTRVEVYRWSNCNGTADVTLYKIVGGGHTWPGSIRPIGNGRRSNEIVASEVLWEFFKDRPQFRPTK